jgi:glycerophosphoryl diester phosphodiesterase
VLHHDPDIGQARIATHTLQQLLALRPNLAKLHDAIELVGGRVPLLIEVKPNEPIEPIVAVIQQHLSGKRTPHDFLVGSFQQKTLRALHAALPRIEPVVIESWSGVRASYRARQLHTKRVSMNARYLWFGFIRSMAHSGYKLAAYTVNEPSKAARWGKYGLYGVITDYPDRFKRTRDS